MCRRVTATPHSLRRSCYVRGSRRRCSCCPSLRVLTALLLFLLVPVLLPAIAPASPVGRHHPNNLISRAIDPSSLDSALRRRAAEGALAKLRRRASACPVAALAVPLAVARARPRVPVSHSPLGGASFLPPLVFVPSSSAAAVNVKSAAPASPDRLTESGLQSPLSRTPRL